MNFKHLIVNENKNKATQNPVKRKKAARMGRN